LFFTSRRLAIALLFGMVAMHTGIFALSGIFFWKWMLADVLLASVLLALRPMTVRQLFSLRSAAAGAVVIIAYAVVNDRPPVLAWYDSPACFRFDVEAVGRSGRTYQAPPGIMAPYDLPFAQGRFYFLTRRPQMLDCMGIAHNRCVLERMKTVQSPEAFSAAARDLGRVRFNESRRRQFARLIKRRFERVQPSWFDRLPKAPQHIWTSARSDESGPSYNGQEPIVEVRVVLRESVCRDGRHQLMHAEEVLRVEIDADAVP